MSGAAYVVGGGLAGLAAAVSLARRGRRVILIEGANQAGGRCRSYFDPALGQVIDNGNHLLLSGNRDAFRYLRTIGAAGHFAGPSRAAFHFVDIGENARWTLRLGHGPVPWWIGARARRVPGTMAADYIAFVRLALARGTQRVGDVVTPRGALWERLLQPFLVAALNTEPERASAALAGAVIRDSLVRGGAACLPRIAHPTLAAALVDPALAYLKAHGAEVRLGERVRRVVTQGTRVLALEMPSGTLPVSADDAVVIAIPPWGARELMPGLTVPDDFRAIVNGHFRLTPGIAPLVADAPPILGVIGGTAEWVFTFEDRISVTVSNADAIVDRDREALAATFWRDIAAALGLPPATPMPPWQVVKEKRATFAATPEQEARRPGPRTAFGNLFLAGDWTATGLPATIEGAIRSGHTVAKLAARMRAR